MATPGPRPKLTASPSRHVYDVIVLGSQLGGALSAALLAKRGYRVLLVEHDGIGTGYEHGDYLLPYAPFVTPPLKYMPAVEEAFTELGLTTPLQRTLKPHQPELQLLLPRHRLNLVADPAKRSAELRREFPDQAEQLQSGLAQLSLQHEGSDAFFKDSPNLPPDGMMDNWALQKRIRQFTGLEAPPLLMEDLPPSALVRGLLPFISHLYQPQGGLALNRPLSQVLRAPLRYPGGREGLRELLCKRLRELGGDVLSRELTDTFMVEEVSFDGNRFEGVKVFRSDNLYRGACLVAATDAGALRRLIVDKKKQRALSEHLEQSSTKAFLFTVNWVLPVSALPRGLGELALMDSQNPELGALLIQLHPARNLEGKEEPTRQVVCASAFVPASAREMGEEYLRKIADGLDSRLEQLMPFAKERRLLRSAPYLDAGGLRGSRLMPHPLYSFENESTLGVTGLAQKSPVKNLFLAGREVLPGLGVEGEWLAGMRTARLVQEALKKHDPLKR